ncbi:MAG: dTDP-4-dehydrorhamnose reductase [Burkholderiaceae bacterium]
MLNNQPTRVLITGAGGQLGQSFQWLQRTAAYPEIELIFATHQELDICDAATIASFLDATPVDVLVNAAAYTAVDDAESNPRQADRVNAVATRLLAQACRQRGIWMLHISTDYVFDGTKSEPYGEDDAVNPLSAYGKTKLAGEQAVQRAAPNAAIVRTSWVFSPFGRNFLKTMLHLAKSRADLNIVNDQFGGPSYAMDVARILLRLIEQNFKNGPVPGGVYHFAGTPHVSWFEFSNNIFKQATELGLLTQAPRIHGIPSSSYPTPAPRPENSRLSNAKLEKILGDLDCDWQRGVHESLLYLKTKNAL